MKVFLYWHRWLRGFRHYCSLFFVVICLLLFNVLPLAAAPSRPLDKASDWLLSQQQENGSWDDGFTGRGGGGITTEALIALWAAGVDVKSLDPSVAEYLKDFVNLNAELFTPPLAAKMTLAALILDEDVEDFGGINLIEVMNSSPEGMIGQSTFETCLSLIALAGTQTELPPLVVSFIQEKLNTDGAWGFAPGDPSDTNTTAICLQAMIAAHSGNDVIENSLAYLRDQQNSDGGWTFQKPSDFSTDSDTYSTALVVMALNAAGEDLTQWGNPLAVLEAFQTEDGAFRYSRALPDQYQVQATVAAIPALAGKSLLDIHR